jgi:CRISPR/Cas system CMR-associated protein Cmr5 small subunit
MSYLTELTCTSILKAINDEREKEKEKLATDSDDFVNVHNHVNTFWTDLFANCFLCVEEQSKTTETNEENNHKFTISADDMLFFVSKLATDEVIIQKEFYFIFFKFRF